MLLPQLKHGQAAASIVAAAGTGHCQESVKMSHHNSNHMNVTNARYLALHAIITSSAQTKTFNLNATHFK
jgi:hypothetical protein